METPHIAPVAESNELAQLNIKIPILLRDQFNAALATRRESQREVIEHMIQAYTVAIEGRRVLHLDGTICPLSQLILDLTDAVRKQI